MYKKIKNDIAQEYYPIAIHKINKERNKRQTTQYNPKEK